MSAQEDHEALTEILTRAGFTDEERESFTEEVMTKLGHKLQKLFTDAEPEDNNPKGPRRIGAAVTGRKAVGSQYSD